MPDAHPATGERRVAVVTGASSGIGKAAARRLAGEGWDVIGVGRDAGRCAAAQTEIAAAALPGVRVEMIEANLSSLESVARLADTILARTGRLDVLLNNAGGVVGEFHLTPEGHEETLASNHLGPFLLTAKLLPLLRDRARKSAQGTARIVNVSSSAHRRLPAMNWTDLNFAAGFNSGAAYCQAKLANLLFTYELGRRERANGIVVHAMHPGVVASNFGSGSIEMSAYMKSQASRAATPEHAAETLVWLATADEPGQAQTGYWFDRELEQPAVAATDVAEARRLWETSEAETGRF